MTVTGDSGTKSPTGVKQVPLVAMPKSIMKACYLFFYLLISTFSYSQSSIDSYYEGFLPKYDTLKDGKLVHRKDSERSGYYLYSFVQLKLRGDSVYLDDSPSSVGMKDTVYSASDGGFFYFRGTYKGKDKFVTINLTEHFCDYCGVLKQKDANGNLIIARKSRQYNCVVSDNGILIGEYKLAPKHKNVVLRSEGEVPDWWK